MNRIDDDTTPMPKAHMKTNEIKDSSAAECVLISSFCTYEAIRNRNQNPLFTNPMKLRNETKIGLT